MLSIGSLQVFTSKSGALSVRHAERGLLIHSAVDPIAEARVIAAKFAVAGVTEVTIIGSGLGYLERELQAHGIAFTPVEIHPDMYSLRTKLTAGDQVSTRKNNYRLLESAHELRSLITKQHSQSVIHISPYATALADELPAALAAELLAHKVLTASRSLYRPLISNNVLLNEEATRKLPQLQMSGRTCSRIALAIGAGPSLNNCINTIKLARESLMIVAASGAVPVLCANGLSPDWTIALEARENLIQDIEELEDDAKVVVFPWSMPKVFESRRLKVYLADEQTGLETSGGTSGLTAADFAFKVTRGNVYLLGMDLSDANGAYAEGAFRANSEIQKEAPKFASMRTAFEEWLRDHREHRVFQVLGDQAAPLKGVRAINHQRFAEDLLGDLRKSRML